MPPTTAGHAEFNLPVHTLAAIGLQVTLESVRVIVGGDVWEGVGGLPGNHII